MRFVVLLLLLALLMSQINSLRRKRYVAFPEGATMSVAVCMTTNTIAHPMQIFSEGLNWGLSFDLPNNTAILDDFKSPGFVARRRRRRDLYQKMEVMMDSMGYNGRDCILKALCEAGGLFNQGNNGLVQKILRIVFGFPIEDILKHEPNDHKEYRNARISGQNVSDLDECAVRYSECTFSLIDMALGLYTQNIPSLI